MALGDKPTKLPEWASGASAQIDEPTTGKKALGWIKEKPPFKFFNWFWNLVYLWLGWAKKYGEEHIHSGGSGDHDAPKVDLTNHIAWGNNGEFEVITDTALLHEVAHNPIGASYAVFYTDTVNPKIVRIGHTSGEQFELQDGSALATARLAQFVGLSGDKCAVSSEAYQIARDDNPGGDFGLLCPEDTTQYRKNLNKVVSKHNFTEAAGVISNSAVAQYNVPGNWVTAGAPANTFTLAITASTYVQGVALPGASVNQAGADTNQYKADIDYDSATNKFVMRLYHFDSTTNDWLNVRVSGPPTGMDMHVQLLAQ